MLNYANTGFANISLFNMKGYFMIFKRTIYREVIALCD